MHKGEFYVVKSGDTITKYTHDKTDYFFDGKYYRYEAVSGYTDDVIMPDGRVLHIGINIYGKGKNKYYQATDLDSGMGVLNKHDFHNRKEVIEYISRPEYLNAIDSIIKVCQDC